MYSLYFEFCNWILRLQQLDSKSYLLLVLCHLFVTYYKNICDIKENVGEYFNLRYLECYRLWPKIAILRVLYCHSQKYKIELVSFLFRPMNQVITHGLNTRNGSAN